MDGIENSEADVSERRRLIQSHKENNNNNDNDRPFYVNRYFALVLMGFSLLGQNFIVDNPAALEDTLTKVLGLTNAEFSSFYALYNFPNIMLCMISGFIIDKLLGYRLSTILFTVLMTIGQFIFAFGTLWNNVTIMQVGRFVFGCGGESIYLAIFKYAAIWFNGSKQISMALTFLYCIPNMGSVINMYVMPVIYEHLNENVMKSNPSKDAIAVSLIISNSVGIFSMISTIILAIMDKKRISISNEKNEEDTGKNVFRIKYIAEFPFEYWFIPLTTITYFSVIYPFVGNMKLFYMYKYDLTSYQANVCNGMVYTTSAILSPLIGLAVDNVGYNINWMILGIVGTVATHLLITFTYTNPLIFTVLLGIFFTFFSSAVFPSVPLIIKEDALGTAYGFMASLQNLGTTTTSLGIGYIVDKWGYFRLELMFLCYLMACSAFMSLLFITDNLKNGKLNRPVLAKTKNTDELKNE